METSDVQVHGFPWPKCCCPLYLPFMYAREGTEIYNIQTKFSPRKFEVVHFGYETIYFDRSFLPDWFKVTKEAL